MDKSVDVHFMFIAIITWVLRDLMHIIRSIWIQKEIWWTNSIKYDQFKLEIHKLNTLKEFNQNTTIGKES